MQGTIALAQLLQSLGLSSHCDSPSVLSTSLEMPRACTLSFFSLHLLHATTDLFDIAWGGSREVGVLQ